MIDRARLPQVQNIAQVTTLTWPNLTYPRQSQTGTYARVLWNQYTDPIGVKIYTWNEDKLQGQKTIQNKIKQGPKDTNMQ